MQQLISEIVIMDPTTRDTELNTAVKIAAELAAQEKLYGILVTRHDLSRFTVALSSDVPFGLIHEHDLTKI